jgi:hypothetical protein
MVKVATPDGEVDVQLFGLDAFQWTDPDDSTVKQAVLVSTVVDQAVAPAKFDPTAYKYDFIATDGYDILANKLDGDYRGLPTFDNLALGWFIEYPDEDTQQTDIEVVWDDSLGFPKFMGAKLMNGGTIELVENVLFDQDVHVSVVMRPDGTPVDVNLNGLPAFDDNGALAVYLHLIVLEAALDGFDPKTYTYDFNFISNDADGNWSLQDNLDAGQTLPLWLDFTNSQDIHHGWIENTADDGYRLFWDAATGFPGKYGVKHMDDGTIEAYVVTD